MRWAGKVGTLIAIARLQGSIHAAVRRNTAKTAVLKM
jgi:hypothetical protein